MGKSREGLSFLNIKENNDLNKIGYSGKLNKKNITRKEYLNSLNKGEFTVVQTTFDDGSFSEEFLITRVTLNS